MTDAEIEARLSMLVEQTETLKRRGNALRPVVVVMFLVGIFARNLPLMAAATALCVVMALYALLHLARLTWFGWRAGFIGGSSDD